jgi:uncharacterized membrane protein
MWQEESLNKLPRNKGFRLRGDSMTRLEVFSDAAFAFAVTTLVVTSGEIPGNYDELILALKKVPSFALSFAQIIVFWITHRSWSRRYGMEDGWTTFLSLIMIFTILVYVFPLRLMFSMFMSLVVTPQWLPSEFEVNTAEEVLGLFIIYGIGFAILSAVLMSLYWRAFKCRQILALNQLELIHTKLGIGIWAIQFFTGLLSALAAWLLPQEFGLYAPYLYFILPVAIPMCAGYYSKQAKQLNT